MSEKTKPEKTKIFPTDEASTGVDDRQKKYMKTEKGKKAAQKAGRRYDNSNLEKRRLQKRDYMRRKRLENPDIWRG
ncbi:hypothetical protein CL634_03135 [bacterium]|nr:hypothetical protein [bacterium]